MTSLLFIFIQFSLFFTIKSNSNGDEYLSNRKKHLFHFVQVTDLHFTHFAHVDRINQFEEFCLEILRNLIKPPVTIVSGDLVNSANDLLFKGDRNFQPAQYEEEWRLYRNLLDRTNITRFTQWLDMRGNHDTMMDSHPDSENSFYRIYSHQGRNHTSSYQYTYRTNDGDSYSFVSIDMCPRPGLGRPFSILGFITDEEMQRISELSEQTKNSTARIYFGHYPLSFSYINQLPRILDDGLVFLNGHLHSGIKYLYTRHKNRLLEVHLGDWKRKRRFRLLTIDAGLLSFEDFRSDEKIFAVISNPKAAKFKTFREPLQRLKQSSHIRILIFARFSPIVRVDIFIDHQLIGHADPSIDDENLYILRWNTSLYNDENLHRILVRINDKSNNTLDLQHDFSLSEMPMNEPFFSNLILSIRWPLLNIVVLLVSLTFYMFILLYHRYQSEKNPFRFDKKPFASRRLMCLCSVNFLYYSLLGLTIYHFIGPWFLGYLTDDQFGGVFLWGILIDRIYLPPEAQLYLGNIQFFFIIIPFTYTLSSTSLYRYEQIQLNRNENNRSFFDRCLYIYNVYIVFVWTMFILIVSSIGITFSFRLSWFISPFSFPLITFLFFLYIKTHRLNRQDFRRKSSNEEESSNFIPH